MMDVLLRGAVGMLFASLALAWVATFARLVVLRPVQLRIKDSGAIVRAHIDLLLVSPLCMAYYAVRIPLPTVACWMVVIGGFTNPSLFTFRALDPEAPATWPRKTFRLGSFLTTTIGHVWVGCSILQAIG
jgi:hypothetical protein